MLFITINPCQKSTKKLEMICINQVDRLNMPRGRILHKLKSLRLQAGTAGSMEVSTSVFPLRYPKFDKEIKTCLLCVVPHHVMVGPPNLIGKGQQLASLKT